MKPKEIQKKLGINADRIKFFKREGVFTPENPPSGNRGTDYTEADVEALRCLVVLTKMGLTCSDIRRMQEGECTLEAAILERRKNIEADIAKKKNALSLLSELLEDKEEFESFNTGHYWDVIAKREAKGEEFIDPEDVYGYRPVSLVRTVKCPYCGEELEAILKIMKPMLAVMITKSVWVKIWFTASIARTILNVLPAVRSIRYPDGSESIQ